MKENFILLLVFYLALLLSVVFYFLWLIDKRNKIKLHTLRGNWANQLHSDIGGNLSSIKLLLELLSYAPEKKIGEVTADLEIAMDTLNESIHKLRFVIDIVDERKDSLNVVLDNLLHFYQTNFAASGIVFSIERPAPALISGKVDIVRINNLYLLLKEILNNCLKHAKAKNVAFRLTLHPPFILIEIEDDGIGFNSNQQFAGNGLKDLQEHSKTGSLFIHLDTAPNKGTCVSIKVYH